VPLLKKVTLLEQKNGTIKELVNHNSSI